MPLSEYEQRVLEEMEQQLRSDDPKLAKTISNGAPRRPLNVVLGGVIILAGLGVLVAAVSFGQTWLGIIAFVAMFAGVLVALHRPSSEASNESPSQGNVRPLKRPTSSSNDSFMDRLERRWDQRRDER